MNAMYMMFTVIILLGLLIALIGFIIGVIERKRFERKQDEMEYLERKQRQFYENEKNYTNGLKQEKERYEQLLNEMDYKQIPTKEQIQKMHWYMKYFGYIDQQQQNILNQFYDRHYPKNPFE